MKQALNKIFSMPLMALLLFVFFAAIAAATFIENELGTPVAQKWVYKAGWFEAVLAYLFLSLVYNLFRYKLFQLKKLGSLVFHTAFLVIIIGAWITRLIGFEGAMLIREGESSNIIISYDTYMQIKVHDFEQQYSNDIPVIFDGHTHNSFNHTFDFPNAEESISVELVSLLEHAKDTIIPHAESDGTSYLELVTIGEAGRIDNYLESGNILFANSIKIAYNNTEHPDAISIFETDSGLFVTSPFEMNFMQMNAQSEGGIETQGIIKKDSIHEFLTSRLYTVAGQNIMFKTYYPNASFQMIESNDIAKSVKAVTVNITQGNLTKQVVLKGGKGEFPNKNKFQLGNLNYELAYGSKIIELPFSLFLDDFELKRYTGTQNPSSFSSHVTVLDVENNITKPHHIFMNNVLDYGGYRFFQSSYDNDEKGTILSVNHDAIGTNVTYLGYLLLGLGFVISLITKGGRFSYLLRKTKETRIKREKLGTLLLLVGLFTTIQLNAQSANDSENKEIPTYLKEAVIDYDHAEKFGRLVVQNFGGRFQPVHSFANDLLKKINRSTSYNDQSAMQVFLGIHTNPAVWNLEPLIYVSGEGVRKKLNLTENRAALVDFISFDKDRNVHYLLEEDAEIARRKKPSEQNKYDKNILKTDERFNILYGLFTGLYLKIMPLPNDPGNMWYSPFGDTSPFQGEDADFIKSIMPLYNISVLKGLKTDDWTQADKVIDLIDVYQRRVAPPETIPSKRKIEIEIIYNQWDIFKRLNYFYLLVGLVLLILQFIQLFSPRFKFEIALKAGLYIFILLMLAHVIGLGMRWYISGNAPWTNGYEAVVFIGFVTGIAGLLFYRVSPIVLGATGILIWLFLFVAHLSNMDPQISLLAPVLKSYWLMIHVAIITGSYGFLGLGALLGLISLILILFVNKENEKRIILTLKEVTYVSEMVIIIGLFMLTIGTFLGGVWANESWGRYWGWDSKETWALASVVIYAMILHFRFIPGLKSRFAFNVASLWAYATIIMTFFGVNYYLSGLHSYAKGDPAPMPTWVPVLVGVFLLITIGAGLVSNALKRKNKAKKERSLKD